MTTISVKDPDAVTIHWSLDTCRLGAALALWLMPNTKVTGSTRTMCLCHVLPSWERVSCNIVFESTCFSHGAYKKRKGRDKTEQSDCCCADIQSNEVQQVADDLNSVSSLKCFPFASFLSRLSLSCHFLSLLQFFSVIGSAGKKKCCSLERNKTNGRFQNHIIRVQSIATDKIQMHVKYGNQTFCLSNAIIHIPGNTNMLQKRICVSDNICSDIHLHKHGLRWRIWSGQ